MAFNQMRCIVFKNNSQSGTIHTWIFENEETFKRKKTDLEELAYIEILSVREAYLMKG